MTTLFEALKAYLEADATLMAVCDQVLDDDTIGQNGLQPDKLQDDTSDNPFGGGWLNTVYIHWGTLNKLSNRVEQDEEGFVELYFYGDTYGNIGTMRERVRFLLRDDVEVAFDEPSDAWQCGFYWAGGDILRKRDPALGNIRFERSRYRYMNMRSLST